MYRTVGKGLELLIAHPGGPFFAKRREGVWSIPKGLVAEGEDLLAAARREFTEETGFESEGEFLPLGSVQQKGGKIVHAWAFAGDCDPAEIVSNTFRLEWPPRSGREREFPEIDAARFASPDDARRLLLPAQCPFVDRLEAALAKSSSGNN